MSKESYLKVRIEEYIKRYETKAYNPELNILLNDIIKYLNWIISIEQMTEEMINKYSEIKNKIEVC